MVNFLSRTTGAGRSPAPRQGQSPVPSVLSHANTTGRAEIPGATASRGNDTPATVAVSVPAGGCRSASLADRSMTRASAASGSCGTRRIPRPRTSISPASAAAGRTTTRPSYASTWTRSSATETGEAQTARAARFDQFAREPRLAGSGGTADQHSLGADEHGGSMDGTHRSSRGAAGCEIGIHNRFGEI